jgi:lipid-A-disaccharide synthase
VFVGIDAPDFNLGLEARLKSAGIPTVHYVSPSVWAWRRGRIRKIAKSASHLLVLFPFEADLYRDAGLPVTYVGHPVADVVPLQVGKAAAKEQLRLSPNKVIIALLPGSRESELRYMADTFVLTAQRIAEKIPNVQFLCPLGTRQTRDLFEAAIHRHQAQELPITMMFGHSHAALAAADLALVASGTATLETALFKTPMVITYKMAGLTWQMMRRMLYLPYVGLPNILAGEFIVDEFMQDAATPEALSQAMLQLFGDTTRQKQQIARFTAMHETLRQDNAARAADAVMQLARSHQRVGVR